MALDKLLQCLFIILTIQDVIIVSNTQTPQNEDTRDFLPPHQYHHHHHHYHQQHNEHDINTFHMMVKNVILSTTGSQLHNHDHEDVDDLTGNLYFFPSNLNFNRNSIGNPLQLTVILLNRHENRSVVLGLISGKTPDIYSSFFDEKIVPPGGNTTFNIVFLPRYTGNINGTLYIHTSFGLLKYEVKGYGIECPYRLTPLVGIKIPFNSTILPDINLYNPNSEPIQIVEIYSNDPKIQLELPHGNLHGTKVLWEIQPYCSKKIIKIKYTALTYGNHTSYIRIKIKEKNEEKILVIPIEIEVIKETGIYTPLTIVDFGIIGTNQFLSYRKHEKDEAEGYDYVEDYYDDEGDFYNLYEKEMKINLYNSGSNLIDIKNITIETIQQDGGNNQDDNVVDDENEDVEEGNEEEIGEDIWVYEQEKDASVRLEKLLNIKNIKNNNNNEKFLNCLLIKLNVKNLMVKKNKLLYGNIVINTTMTMVTPMSSSGTTTVTDDKHKNSLSLPLTTTIIYRIPVIINILKGGIKYTKNVTRFIVKGGGSNSNGSKKQQRDDKFTTSKKPRDLFIKNYFNVPLIVTKIIIPDNCSDYFSLINKLTITNNYVIVPPSKSIKLFSIKFNNTDKERTNNRTITSNIVIVTNIKSYNIRLVITKGLLQRILPVEKKIIDIDEKTINFGILPISQSSEVHIGYINNNPVDVKIVTWNGTISKDGQIAHFGSISISMRGSGRKYSMDNLMFDTKIRENEWIVFRIMVQSNYVGSFSGSFSLTTEHEEIVTPIKFQTAMGRLEINRELLHFKDCFPVSLFFFFLNLFPPFLV